MSFLDSLFGAEATHKEAAPAPYLAALQRRDYAGAVPLLKAAMRLDDARAMGFMGALTALGHGVEKNPFHAYCWFRQAAARGHVPSQAALGMCLAGGLGVATDSKEAAYWLYRAGKAGNMQAIEVLGALAYRDNSVVGEHFTEDELCQLVLQLHRSAARNSSAAPADARLH